MGAVGMDTVGMGVQFSPTWWSVLVVWLVVSVLIGLGIGRMIRNRDRQEPNGDG